MVRSITAFILIVLVTLTNFSRLFIYAGYELNQEYIVTELCENRDTPELNCNGQCYLSKKLIQAAEKEAKQKQESLKHNFQEAFLGVRIFLISPVLFVKSFFIRECAFDLPQPLLIIFHPPKVF